MSLTVFGNYLHQPYLFNLDYANLHNSLTKGVSGERGHYLRMQKHQQNVLSYICDGVIHRAIVGIKTYRTD